MCRANKSFLKIGSVTVVQWVYIHTFPLSWPVLVKWCRGAFHIMPQFSCEFCNHRGIESGTVLRDVCVLTTLFPFSSIWMKFGSIRDAHNYWMIISFMKVDPARAILCIRPWMNFYPHFPRLIHRLVEIRYKRFANNSWISWKLTEGSP
jgi:hypothetical protein